MKIGKKDLSKYNSLNALMSVVPDDSITRIMLYSARKKSVLVQNVLTRDLNLLTIKYIPSGVFVVDVIKGGASDRAGLKYGDIITGINGKSFENATEADQIMRSLIVGKRWEYEVLRQDSEFHLPITLEQFGISFSVLFLFISSVMFISVGMFFYLKRPKLKVARLSGLGLMLIGFNLGTNHGAIIHPNVFTITVMVLNNISLLMGIAVLFHSLYYFPNERTDILAHKWPVYWPYTFSGVTLVLVAIWVIYELPAISILITQIALLIAFCSFYLLIHNKFRKSASKEDIRISLVLKCALLANLLLLAVKPIMSWASADSTIYLVLSNVMNYSGLITLLIPIAYLYSVGRYRLLDLDFRLRKNNQYFILAFSWIAFIVLAFASIVSLLSMYSFTIPNLHFTGASIIILDKPLRPELANLYENILNMWASVGIALVCFVVGKKGLRFLDKIFYRAKFDFRKVSEDFSRIIDKNLEVESLLAEVVDKVKSVVFLRKAAIIIFPYSNNKEVELKCKFSEENDKGLFQIIELYRHQFFNIIEQISGSFRSEYLEEPLKSAFLVKSYRYLIPVRAKGVGIGVILLGDKLSESPFNNEDLEFINSYASQAAIAIDNTYLYQDKARKERMQNELELARKIQKGSLPKNKPNFDDLDIAAVSVPAYEVGGDFYDYLEGSSKALTVIVGDVSGKGAYAALQMSKAQGIFRTLYEFELNPKDLLARTNKLLFNHIEKTSFISALAIKFDTENRTFKLARAGHLPVIYFNRAKKKVEEIAPKGLVLGVCDYDKFYGFTEEQEYSYSVGDIFLLATDGAIEASFENREFGIPGLKYLIEKYNDKSADELVPLILEEIKNYSNNNQIDDLTLVVIKVMG